MKTEQELDDIIRRHGLGQQQPSTQAVQPQQEGGVLRGSALLQSLSQPEAVEQPEEKGFLGRIGESFQERGQQIKKAFGKSQRFQQDPISTGVQTVGAVAGLFGDILGESIITGVKVLTPDAIEEGVKKKGRELLQTEAGQTAVSALGQGIDAYQDFKDEHPTIAANLEATVNIADLVLLARGSQAVKGVTKLTGVLEESAERVTR